MKITEDNVVQHIKKKNEKALSFIINQYGGLLTVIIKRQLNYQQQDYEECLDDVLLSIWNHIDMFDERKNSFKQWIAAIAKYKAIDYKRKQMTIQNKQYSVATFEDSMVKSIPLQYDVEELLLHLSPKERVIFEKFYLEGTPSNEIAKEFKMTPSWVHNKLSRGRKKLKNLLFLTKE